MPVHDRRLCDDGAACTANDRCTAGTCSGAITTLDQVGCSLAQLSAAPYGAEPIPNGLARALSRTVDRVDHLLAKAAKLAGSGKTDKAEHLRQRALNALDALATKADKAASTYETAKRITAGCRDTLTAMVTARHSVVASFVF